MPDQPILITAFFYGLFMDEALLREIGLNPLERKQAFAPGYGLRIGQRATMEKSAQEQCHGILFSMTAAEIEQLYSSDSVADYISQTIQVVTVNGEKMNVACYLLPMEKITGSNPDYARNLAIAAREANLPESSIREIESWID